MKNTIYILTLLLIFTSCSDEVEDKERYSISTSKEICFNADIIPHRDDISRADEKDLAINNMEDFKRFYGNRINLFAIYTGTNRYSYTQDYEKSDFIYYNDILQEHNGKWKASSEKYWPSEGEKLSFFAFTPLLEEIDNPKNVPYPIRDFRIINPETPFLHFDPLYCIEQKNLSYKKDEDNTVKLRLKHALSKFKFRIKLEYSEEELRQYWKALTDNQLKDEQIYFYVPAPQQRERIIGNLFETTWETRWLVRNPRLLFLIDDVIIENVRTKGSINILTDNDEYLWNTPATHIGERLKTTDDDITPSICYEPYPEPEHKDRVLNKYLVWKSLEDEALHNTNKNLPPWNNKENVIADKIYDIFKKEMFILPGEYKNSSEMINIKIVLHAILVGEFQREFYSANNLQFNQCENFPVNSNWWYYKDEKKLKKYPEYRAFYGKLKSVKQTIGPLTIKKKQLLPNTSYDITIAIGVSSSDANISVKPWEEEVIEETIEEKAQTDLKVKEWKIIEGATLDKNTNPAVVTIGNNNIAKAECTLDRDEKATLLVQVVPTKGNPGAFEIENADGGFYSMVSRQLDGKSITITVRRNEPQGNSEAILRFFIKYGDNTTKLFSILGDDKEIIIK